MHSLLIAGCAALCASAFVVGFGLFRLALVALRLPRVGSLRDREASFFLGAVLSESLAFDGRKWVRE